MSDKKKCTKNIIKIKKTIEDLQSSIQSETGQGQDIEVLVDKCERENKGGTSQKCFNNISDMVQTIERLVNFLPSTQASDDFGQRQDSKSSTGSGLHAFLSE